MRPGLLAVPQFDFLHPDDIGGTFVPADLQPPAPRLLLGQTQFGQQLPAMRPRLAATLEIGEERGGILPRRATRTKKPWVRFSGWSIRQMPVVWDGRLTIRRR